MAQQKGFKRAAKVLNRKRKLVKSQKQSNLKKLASKVASSTEKST